MSTTTTNIEVSAHEFQAIELEPIGYSAPVATTPNRKSLDDFSARDISAESLTQTQTGAAIAVPEISRWKALVIIITVASVTLVQNMLGGVLVVGLPTMAVDLGLSNDLLLWPASVGPLASGCTLLVSGSVADVIGGRKIYLTGAFLLTFTTIASGLSRTGIELILFRAAQGIALSLTLPASVKLITSNIPSGTGRNIAFACLGAAQPVGFSVGLVMGGLFVQSIGWRWGYHIGAIVTFGVFVISVFFIPVESNAQNQSYSMIISRMKSEIDWTGCFLLSTTLGMFSYVLSVLSGGASHFLEPVSLALFSIAVALLPIFAFYSRRQERLNRKVIIPPSIWNSRVFTSLCVTIFVMSGVFNAVLFFLTLFFQSVQGLSGLQTSIRFLPMIVTGAATNLLTGWLVKKTRADVLILSSTFLSAISPLLMAIIKPEWTYFSCAFFAVTSAPICEDVLFTVANLVITSVFPPESHGLAGGVFNTLNNVGNSFGLAITAVIASSITMAEQSRDETAAEMLMDGYRVTFWVCFAANILVLGVITFGLRKIGKVGIKHD